MKLFFSYLRQHRLAICTYIIFCAVFFLSFYLYELPMAAVSYPTLLCAVIGIIALTLDFLKTKRRHETLRAIIFEGSELISELPEASSILSEDYCKIITALRDECRSTRELSNAKFADMTEYYTMWVHQIKTPIASMRLCLQDRDTAEARRLFADLFRIEQYVDMVMVYLRLDGDGSDYVFSEMELDSVLKRSLRRFSSEFIDRKLSLSFEPTGKRIVTDEKWLGFVIDQLLSNALKYTQSGGIKLYLADKDILCIEDSGIGIAPEDLPRVFERGYTGHNGRTDMRASGIGLYLCSEICKKLGITLTATSTVGKGTVMRLDLRQHRTD